MSAFCVRAAARHVLHTGGMVTSIWALLSLCKRTDGSLTPGTKAQRIAWTSFEIPSRCTVVTQL